MTLGLLFVLATTTAIIISTVAAQNEELAYNQAVQMAQNYANEFNGDMQSNKAIAKTLAVSMTNHEFATRKLVNNILEEQLIAHPQLIGTYVAYEPNAFDGQDELYVNTPGHDSTGRFIPYWNKINGPIDLDPLKFYDTLD